MTRRERADAHTLQADLLRLQNRAGSAAERADRILRDTVSTTPLLAVGAAAGLGFLIGGGLPRGSLGLFVGVGARMAGAWLQREFLENPDTQE
jgi:hypothetical protein